MALTESSVVQDAHVVPGIKKRLYLKTTLCHIAPVSVEIADHTIPLVSQNMLKNLNVHLASSNSQHLV